MFKHPSRGIPLQVTQWVCITSIMTWYVHQRVAVNSKSTKCVKMGLAGIKSNFILISLSVERMSSTNSGFMKTNFKGKH